MHCTRALVADSLPDDPNLERVLFAYFPAALVDRYGSALRRHRLRREIIATTLTNLIVDLMGATFITRTMRDTGASAAEVVRALVVVEALTGARELFRGAADAAPGVDARFLDVLGAAIERATRWLIETCSPIGLIDRMIARFQEPVRTVLDALSAADREGRARRLDELRAEGLPSDLAQGCVAAEWLRPALDVVQVAAEAGVSPRTSAAAYQNTQQVFDFAWLRHALQGAAGEDRWERRAVESLCAELDRLQRRLTRQLLPDGGDPTARVGAFRIRHADDLARIRGLLDDLRSARSLTLPAAMVMVRELARLEETT
jgi:glutamate dehydrogenase